MIGYVLSVMRCIDTVLSELVMWFLCLILSLQLFPWIVVKVLGVASVSYFGSVVGI